MLTDVECKNATCPPDKKRVRLACSGGLYLEVGPNGSKRWFWKYRKNGKEGRMALGSHHAGHRRVCSGTHVQRWFSDHGQLTIMIP